MSFSNFKSKIWILSLILLLCYLFYQLIYGWDNQDGLTGDKSIIEDEKVAFVVVEENNYPSKKSTLQPILDNLIVWNYDDEKNEVFLKFDALLPKTNSKVMIVYDRGFETFQSHAEVFSVNKFPYKYYFNNKPLLSIYDANKDGTVYMDFEGKRIKLDPNSTYRSAGIDNFKFNTVKIHNYGLINKNQFKSELKEDTLYNELLVRFVELSEVEKKQLKEYIKATLQKENSYSVNGKQKLISDMYEDFSKQIKK